MKTMTTGTNSMRMMSNLMSSKNTYKVTLEFDNEDSAREFVGHWLDGGGDGGGNKDWDTKEWTDHNYMRISGTGHSIEWIDGEMIVMTPEEEEKQFKAEMKKYERK